MKRTILFSIITLFLQENSFSQNIGINTTGAAANSSALLDVGDGNATTGGDTKGLLIPRVALISTTDATTISSPATSLIVYNSGSGGLTPAGYYYNIGTPISPLWQQFVTTNTPGGGNCFNNWQLYISGATSGMLGTGTPGSFTVPAGVTVIKVEVYGGGGGGGTGINTARGGGGGGGGGYAVGIYTVIPSTTYTVIIGSGGGPNAAGGTTQFGSPPLISATGGNGSGSGGSGAVGGDGGIGLGGYYNGTLGSGGNGAIEVTINASNGGGGGGSGGSGSGADGAGGGGGGDGGGNGGGGGSQAGKNAVPNSGAGGGGAMDVAAPGNGANGRVIVYW